MRVWVLAPGSTVPVFVYVEDYQPLRVIKVRAGGVGRGDGGLHGGICKAIVPPTRAGLKATCHNILYASHKSGVIKAVC